MAAFICRMCGGILDIPDKMRICKCRACGVVQSVPFLDDSEKETACRNAERLRREGNYDEALELLNGLVKLSPADADLYWASALCRYGVEFSDGGPTIRRAHAKSFLSDEDYRTALRFADKDQRRIMETAAAHIDKLRRKNAPKLSGERKVMLVCDDETIGSKLREKLTSAGYAVLSRDSENLSAASSAGAAVIFGECETELINALESSGTAIIPVVRGTDVDSLPKELRRFQAADMRKLGWESDILSSLAAIFGRGTALPPSRSSEPMLRRIYIMLEDGDFIGAAGIADKLLEKRKSDCNICAEAYLAKLLCEYRLTSEEQLGTLSADVSRSENYRRAMQHGNEGFRLRVRGRLNGV